MDSLPRPIGEIEKKIDGFLEYMEVERGSSPLTIRNYSHYLRRFSRWMKNKNITSLTGINQESVRQYRLYLSRLEDDKKRNLSKKNSRLSCNCLKISSKVADKDRP